MDPVERQTLSIKQTQDIKILQKVNAAHREQFPEKFPRQTEHCLRLTMERLQWGLEKREGVNIANPDTWLMSTAELRDLAETARHLHEIRKAL